MLNEAQIIGNLGRDPDIRSFASGDRVANLAVATSERWKDKASGEMKEKTQWHNVVIFGPLVDVVEKYLTKGSKVYLKGQLETRKWQDQSGQDRYTTEIVVRGFGGRMLMLDGKPGGGGGQSQQGGGGQYGGQAAPPVNDLDDSIPFVSVPDGLIP